MFKYCSKCGHKNEFSLKEPKFCMDCGKDMSIKTVNIQSPSVKELEILSPEIDIETEEIDIPNIKSIEIDLECPSQEPLTLGQVIGTKGTNIKRAKNKKTKKQLLAEFKREAGSRK